MKKFSVFSMLFMILAAGCSVDQMFQQPQVTVIGYELVGLPGENTDLLVECDIKNMDTHDGNVQSVNYTAVIEGVSSLGMTYSTPFTMKGSETVRMKLPLTIPTADAALLLDKLNAGKGLNFTVTGKIIADTFLGRQELTLNTSGTANVTIGIEDFFIQPWVNMNETKGFYVTSYTLPTLFDMNGAVQIQIRETFVSNNDSHAASIKQMVYTVTIEGASSQKMTTNYSTPIPIAAAGSVNALITLTNLPISFTFLSLISKVPLLTNQLTNVVNYTIVGTAQVTSDLGSGAMDFYLPINLSGSNTILFR